MSEHADLQHAIDAAFDDGSYDSPAARSAVAEALDLLDAGEVRIAEPREGAGDAGGEKAGEGGGERAGEGGGEREWVVNQWLKRAVLLSFRQRDMETVEVGPFEYRDKVPLKHGFEAAGVRVVPPATVRHGAFIEAGAVLMPSYVNIGARVGSGTMVDTWATVGSCAQIGRNVHLSGGVGIGGVLEPPGARPVIIEDNAFIGSRCIVVEGVVVGEGAVLAAGTVLTASTPIIDVTGSEPVTTKGRVPPRAVVLPGTRPKEFPAGIYHIPCVLVIGQRSASTDKKVSLNQALRDHDVPV